MERNGEVQLSPVSFGEWVQNRRTGLDLTRNQLAHKVGCSPVTIKKIERDERRPSRQIAELLAEHLFIPADQVDQFIRKARGEYVELVPQNEMAEQPAVQETKPTNNLPTPPTPFIGREAELDALIAHLLDPNRRLITVTGVGGMGKTRLALEAAGTVCQKGDHPFSDGVFLIDLSTVAEESYLVATIADRLTLSNHPNLRASRLPKTILFDFLRHKRLLLILDHFENREEDTELVLDLLQAAPDLKLLVTSRERLSLHEEQIFPIQGLSYPDEVSDPYAEHSPAVTLFVSAAQRLEPSFALNQANLPAILRLCQLVEGMPLAIELAATWIDMLTPAEIVDEVQKNLDFLTTVVRNFPERHRHIRAVFDASWAKLTPPEQTLLPQLALFSGRFSRQAAMSITVATIPILGRLVERSLLRYSQVQGFYRMNGLLRQYALERLEDEFDAAALNTMRLRHSHYYMEAIAKRERQLKGEGQQQAIRDIEEDIHNVRSAWTFALKTGDLALLEMGQESLANFLDMSGRFREGEKRFSKLIRRLEEIGQADLTKSAEATVTYLQAHGCLWISVYAMALGQTEYAQQHVDLALIGLETTLPQATEPAERNRLNRLLAFARYMTGRLVGKENPVVARPLFEEGLEINRKLDMPWEEASIRTALGNTLRRLGQYEAAANMLHAGLVIRQSLGDQIGATATMAALSELANYRGQFFEGMQLAQTGVDLARKIENMDALARSLSTYGLSAFYLGRYEEQHVALIESISLYEEMGNSDRLAESYFKLSMANAALGNYEEGGRNIQRGLSYARPAGNLVEEGLLLFSQARLMMVGKHYDSAKQMLTNALALMPSNLPSSERNRIEALLGFAEYYRGNPTPGKRILFQTLETAIGLEDTISLLSILPFAAVILADQGDGVSVERAIELWKAIERQSPTYHKAEFLAVLYTNRLQALEAALDPELNAALVERMQRNSLWDEAFALRSEIEGWGGAAGQ